MKFESKSETILNCPPLNIRNICLLAHVDHGKTTFADHIIACNGLISNRTAGKLRYMDNRKEEQERGITIKSSCISLIYSYKEKSCVYSNSYVINLIDSPGHIDFNNEVSVAARLSDSAIILIDVIEGLCAQTQTVMRQAWNEGIKMLLVINKMDRLITEIKLTPVEAYQHITKLLLEVNSYYSELVASNILQREDELVENSENSCFDSGKELQDHIDDCDNIDEEEESDAHFSPLKSNVIFACALDGWCFDLASFAQIYSNKLGFSQQALNKTLWGDYHINAREKRIKRGGLAKNKNPLFVSLILQNLWNVYDIILNDRNKSNIEKIFRGLNIDLPTKDVTTYEPRYLLTYLMQKWIPISTVFLDIVCRSLPGPLKMTNKRIKTLLPYLSLTPITLTSNQSIEYYIKCVSSNMTQQQTHAGLIQKPMHDDPILPHQSIPLIAFVCKIFKNANEPLGQKNTAKLISKSILTNGYCDPQAQDSVYNSSYRIDEAKGFQDKIAERKARIRQYKTRFAELSNTVHTNNDEEGIQIFKSNDRDIQPRALLPCDTVSQESENAEFKEVPKEIDPSTRVLALCKVYSGVLRPNTSYFIARRGISAAKDQNAPKQTVVQIKKIYLCCGGNEDLVDIERVAYCPEALNGFVKKTTEIGVGIGNIVAVELLYEETDFATVNQSSLEASFNEQITQEHFILPKYFTISSDPACPAFSGLYYCNQPLLEVAIEPKRIGQFRMLQKALEILCNTDPSSTFYLSTSGQLILKVIGEVHLEHCILELSQIIENLQKLSQTSHKTPKNYDFDDDESHDMTNKQEIEDFYKNYAVSDPIIPFRETISQPCQVDLRQNLLEPSAKDVSPQGPFMTVLRDLGVIIPVPEDRYRYRFVEYAFEIVPLPVDLIKFIEHTGGDLLDLLYPKPDDVLAINNDTNNTNINNTRTNTTDNDSSNINSLLPSPNLVVTKLTKLAELCIDACNCDRPRQVKKFYSRLKYETKRSLNCDLNEVGRGGDYPEDAFENDERSSTLSSFSKMSSKLGGPSRLLPANLHPINSSELGDGKLSTPSVYSERETRNISQKSTKINVYRTSKKVSSKKQSRDNSDSTKFVLIDKSNTAYLPTFCWCQLAYHVKHILSSSYYHNNQQTFQSTGNINGGSREEDSMNYDLNLESIYGNMWLTATGPAPKIGGPNLLINAIPNLTSGLCNVDFNCSAHTDIKTGQTLITDCVYRKLLQTGLVGAFHQLTQRGPLCEEPLRGVAYIVKDIYLYYDTGHKNNLLTASDVAENNNLGCINSTNLNTEKKESTKNSIAPVAISYPYVSLNTLAQRTSKMSFSNDDIFNETSTLEIATSIETQGLRHCLKTLVRDILHINPFNQSKKDAIFNIEILNADSEERESNISESSQIENDDINVNASYESDNVAKTVTSKTILVGGLLSGRIMSETRDAFTQVFLKASPRLMLATYDCVIQTKVDAMGKMYSVLNKRYGKVLGEDCIEGTQLFSVRASLPVVESFGFTRELRTKTSGLANPQLTFSHWELLDEDPLTTADLQHIYNPTELEFHFKNAKISINPDTGDIDENEEDEQSSLSNRAQTYLYDIRKRKGLSVREKLVEKAEKQRTLKKNV